MGAVASIYAQLWSALLSWVRSGFSSMRPYLVLDKEGGDITAFEKLYEPILTARSGSVKLLPNTYFNIGDAYEL